MANNYYTRSFIKPVIQSWLASMECTIPSSLHNRLYVLFDTGKVDDEQKHVLRVGIVQFYDKSSQDKEKSDFYGDLMELSIYEDMAFEIEDPPSISKEIEEKGLKPCFWLHFEMHDFEFVMEQLSDFFKYIYDVKGNQMVQTLEKVQNNIQNILICCTAGVTSGYFAGMMQKRVDEECPESHIHVDNCNVNFVGDVIDKYDVVLIAPQIAYMEKDLKQKYGEKIQVIDRVDFATFNFDGVLDKLLKK